MKCRFCKTKLSHVFIDLQQSPASNSFLTQEQLGQPEAFYPLKVYTCHHCFLVQIAEYKKCDTIFDNQYVYFSSYSSSWLKHAEQYTESMIDRFGFNAASQVVEIASNDGYLLQYFKEHNIPVLGIEPTGNTAQVAISKGIETIIEFFGTELAREMVKDGKKADLLIGNNVLAHVPNILDFVAGLKLVLKDDGVLTMEFPHLMQLVENNQFDTIYHEHFSYLSFHTVKQIFESQGLELFDVDEIPTHGGSLRIYAKHKDDKSKAISANVRTLLQKEASKGMTTLEYYNNFQEKAIRAKSMFNNFLLQQKMAGKTVAGYGAAAKGNTFLNYCGVGDNQISFVVDANPYKQNKYLPASHIKVVDENYLEDQKPNYIVIFPWNIKEEIVKNLSYVERWNCKFVVAIPFLKILDEVQSMLI
ncbi:class I SAM-dependent methyltransferase [Mucilaginibacter sp. PAMB04274]|uniref:class I SAM-dependent methyltransferase n=1 Tax=Mucilaginibacter sp. PAMB04274 TaxID=3138568 RepID=UPI0031F6CB65